MLLLKPIPANCLLLAVPAEHHLHWGHSAFPEKNQLCTSNSFKYQWDGISFSTSTGVYETQNTELHLSGVFLRSSIPPKITQFWAAIKLPRQWPQQGFFKRRLLQYFTLHFIFGIVKRIA